MDLVGGFWTPTTGSLIDLSPSALRNEYTGAVFAQIRREESAASKTFCTVVRE